MIVEDALTARERLIVALDVPDFGEALSMVCLLKGEVSFFKVGLGLFCRVGPEGIKRLKGEGIRLFLDLKLHDIPAVVREAAIAAAYAGADMMTIHASGGLAMMSAAAEGVREESRKTGMPLPTILGVTVLTSLDRNDLTVLGGTFDLEERVLSLADLCDQAGLDGLVSSAMEAAKLKEKYGNRLVLVTPGIRPVAGDHGDQKRVATPAAAIKAGADYLVVGRSIISSADPLEAARSIIKEIEENQA